MQEATTDIVFAVAVCVVVEGVDYGAVFISRDRREEGVVAVREGAVTLTKAGVGLPPPEGKR